MSFAQKIPFSVLVAVGVVLLGLAVLGPSTFAAQQGPPFGQGPGSGPRFGDGPGTGPWFGESERGAYRLFMHDAMAEALGMSSDELYEARRAGKTLATLAEEQGVALEPIMERIGAIHRDAVEAAVTDGSITRQQADRMLDRAQGRRSMQSEFPAWRGGPGPGRGGTGGRCPW